MALEYPPSIKFEDIISYTLPGSLSALSLFMLVDDNSPRSLIPNIGNDLNSLVAFLGIMLFFGTILGIIMDGIRQCVLMRIFYSINKSIKKLDDNISYNKRLARKMLSFDDAKNIDGYINEQGYAYVQFYCNLFLALVPMGLIIPHYLSKMFLIDWFKSVLLGLLLIGLAAICIYSAYDTYELIFTIENEIYENLLGRLSLKNKG